MQVRSQVAVDSLERAQEELADRRAADRMEVSLPKGADVVYRAQTDRLLYSPLLLKAP